MKQRGFTLIELLVVVSIITLIASVTLVAFNNARISARNAKRIADMQQLVDAFSQALSAGGTLPNTSGDTNGWACISSSCYGGWNVFTNDPNVTAFLAPYIYSLPSDPQDNTRSSGGYVFNSNYAGAAGWPAGPVVEQLIEIEPSGFSCGFELLSHFTGPQGACFHVLID